MIPKVTLSRTTGSLNTALPEWKQFRNSIKASYRDKLTTNKIDTKFIWKCVFTCSNHVTLFELGCGDIMQPLNFSFHRQKTEVVTEHSRNDAMYFL